MCFSAEADFAAAAIIAPVGVATLRRVRHREELVIGALPLLFAAHQLVEGFVWLGVQGEVSRAVQEAAARAYLIFAEGLLPILVPIGLWLLEPDRSRRRWVVPLIAVGLAVGGYLLWATITQPIGVVERDSALSYQVSAGIGGIAAVGYIAATCGPALLSTRRYLRWFGGLNLVGVGVVALFYSQAVVSLWCVYAAIVSVLVLVSFRHRRRVEGERVGPRWEGRALAALGH